MSTSTAITVITSMIESINYTLGNGLPLVLGLIGVLIGFMFVIRFIFKRIGRAK